MHDSSPRRTLNPPRRHRPFDREPPPNPERETTSRMRSSRRMTTFSLRFRSTHRMCCDPFGVHRRMRVTVGAQEIHHIIGIVARPDLAYDPENVVSLCTRCHHRIEGYVRSGVETTTYFPRRQAK